MALPQRGTENVQIDKADYLFMHSEDIRIENYSQNGNYSFQYCKMWKSATLLSTRKMHSGTRKM